MFKKIIIAIGGSGLAFTAIALASFSMFFFGSPPHWMFWPLPVFLVVLTVGFSMGDEK